MPRSTRRAFVQQGCCSLAALAAAPALWGAPSVRHGILDAHIHLFDPTRPGGVPWPEPSDRILYQPSLPARYRSIAAPLGVVGAVAIECSPLVQDNDWLLACAASDPIIVGVIGNLDPTLSSFPADLERLAGNPLLLGIRYGNLWHRSLREALAHPLCVPNLKRLGDAGKLLETANPDAALIADLVSLTDRVPSLRVVIDHLAQAPPSAEPLEKKQYESDLTKLSERPQVFVKGSEVFRRVAGNVMHDVGFYQAWLDQIWGWFGEDRLFFGSDWPNSDHMATYAETLALVKRYIGGKGAEAERKFFATNSKAIYRWRARSDAQEKVTAQVCD